MSETKKTTPDSLEVQVRDAHERHDTRKAVREAVAGAVKARADGTCVRCGEPYGPSGSCSRRQEGCQGGRGEAAAPFSEKALNRIHQRAMYLTDPEPQPEDPPAFEAWAIREKDAKWWGEFGYVIRLGSTGHWRRGFNSDPALREALRRLEHFTGMTGALRGEVDQLRRRLGDREERVSWLEEKLKSTREALTGCAGAMHEGRAEIATLKAEVARVRKLYQQEVRDLGRLEERLTENTGAAPSPHVRFWEYLREHLLLGPEEGSVPDYLDLCREAVRLGLLNEIVQASDYPNPGDPLFIDPPPENTGADPEPLPDEPPSAVRNDWMDYAARLRTMLEEAQTGHRNNAHLADQYLKRLNVLEPALAAERKRGEEVEAALAAEVALLRTTQREYAEYASEKEAELAGAREEIERRTKNEEQLWYFGQRVITAVLGDEWTDTESFETEAVQAVAKAAALRATATEQAQEIEGLEGRLFVLRDIERGFMHAVKKRDAALAAQKEAEAKLLAQAGEHGAELGLVTAAQHEAEAGVRELEKENRTLVTMIHAVKAMENRDDMLATIKKQLAEQDKSRHGDDTSGVIDQAFPAESADPQPWWADTSQCTAVNPKNGERCILPVREHGTQPIHWPGEGRGGNWTKTLAPTPPAESEKESDHG